MQHPSQPKANRPQAEGSAPSGLRLPRRYRYLDVLGHGGMGEVYRVFDRLSGQTVALKHVRRVVDEHEAGTELLVSQTLIVGGDGPDTGVPTIHDPLHASLAPIPRAASSLRPTAVAVLHHQRLAIAHEFRTLASLRHPHIISVIDYGFDEDGSPFFTMELLPDAQPFTVASHGQPLDVLAERTGQMLSALSYLHRHGILHRDLKPSNVLWANGRVKLLDFGVAAHASGTQDVAGTLEYMAPELLLGAPPSVASDLYAVGVLLWESLTGQYPFARESAAGFLADVLGPEDSPRFPERLLPLLQRPEWSSKPLHVDPGRSQAASRQPLLFDQLPSAFRDFVRRLLQRDPMQRFASAEAATQALASACNIELAGLHLATRECLLSAAPLLGRAAEVSILRQSLHQAQKGHGSLVLLGGESGVGKSRLMEEVRTLALVAGFQVFRGQAASEGQSPLEELAQIVRPLSLTLDIDDDAASVLHDLIPDLGGLLGRPIAAAPALDSQATQQRLQSTIADLLQQIQSASLVLLEDAQWAASETLDLLGDLQSRLPHLPLLIVVSYRDDECPDLPQRLPNAQLVPVLRLDAQAVGELATTLLGPLGSQHEIQQQLLHESEGNTLFLIEVARALADSGDASSLTRSPSAQGLVGRTLTGGMLALLQRRLRRIAESDLPILQRMAVAGRQIDLAFLRTQCRDPDAFLGSCDDAAVLEVSDDRWRFSHDKLREALLADLDRTQLQTLHRDVGEALESLYRDQPDHAAALAHHFERAGLPTRALHYALLAGEHALRRGALVEAERILESTTRSLPSHSTPLWQTAKAFRLQAEALAGLGRTAACVQTSLRGLDAMGHPVPQQKAGLISGIAQQLVGQVQRRLTGDAKGVSTQIPLWRAEEARLLALVGEASVFSLQHLQMAYCMLASTNAADDSHAVDQQVYGYSSLALLLSASPLRSLAHGYFARAESLLRQHATQESRAAIELHRLRAIVCVGGGQLHEALRQAQRAVAMATRLHDAPLRMFGLLVQRMANLHLGLFRDALIDSDEIARLARAGHNDQQLTWALTISAMLSMRTGQLDRAQRELSEAESAVQRADDQMARCAIDALSAGLALRLGDAERARSLLGPAFSTLKAAKMTVPGLLVCFRGLIEAGLALEPHASPDPSQPEPTIIRDVRTLVSRLARYAKANPVARPAAALYAGLLALRDGDPATARTYLLRALRTAQQLQMPFDQAEAHHALSLLPDTDRRSGWSSSPLFPVAAHRAAARQLFVRLGADWHVAVLDGDTARMQAMFPK